MNTHFGRISACLTLLCLSGCAIHTPFEVVRFWSDYNTERKCNAQVEVFDHLPPKTSRVKLMRWGYNVGPGIPSGTGTMGIGTGVWEERLMFWRRWDQGAATSEMPMDINTPPVPPLQPGTLPSAPESPPPSAIPVLPPPAPPAEAADSETTPSGPLRSNLSAARPSRQIATVGHQTGAGPESTRAVSAAWMFTPPARSRKP